MLSSHFEIYIKSEYENTKISKSVYKVKEKLNKNGVNLKIGIYVPQDKSFLKQLNKLFGGKPFGLNIQQLNRKGNIIFHHGYVNCQIKSMKNELNKYAMGETQSILLKIICDSKKYY